MSVYRIYVEKKDEFAVEAKKLNWDIKNTLGIASLKSTRIINRYDVENIEKDIFEKAKTTIFSEPQVDNFYTDLPNAKNIIASEYLPGQFDQRADSCEQCIQIASCSERPTVKTAKIYIFEGNITPNDLQKIKSYIINPIECQEASLEEKSTLKTPYNIPQSVDVIDDFNDMNKQQLVDFIHSNGLAMDVDDIKFCQNYFKNVEHRPPTITEIKVIDTYWSDHCRHTTFLTKIENIKIDDSEIAKAFEEYKAIKKSLGRDNKPTNLMDIATIAARKLKADGHLKDLDESEEINACSVKIQVESNEKLEDWLLMFKNETHNHPTEIEPFGGAATCLGGAIRDPLSGRSYVYQAMRVTGAADPTLPLKDTINGKLPQRKIVTTSANGYSSYGNQIGLATGHVKEIYHPGYVAKRMEIGAVVGAAPKSNVVREVPSCGDVVILLGGKTGRDGCGGATGSSKSHDTTSLESCGAEVQKGNPPEERKIQRLFRDPEITRIIKRCNDFGAGGVSVAIGELADGLHINLNSVPKKYEGLDGTELAISESQERMAVVISKENMQMFLTKAKSENLMATKVADITDTNRLIMEWNGQNIVDISREFLNSNGAEKTTNIEVTNQDIKPIFNRKNIKEDWLKHLSDLNICSQKGLVERFDSTIGASSVLMPLGGENQTTETQAMVSKIPTIDNTSTASIMSWGFDPFLSSQSPFYAAQYAVIDSVAKIIAAGGSTEKCWLTFQEYFPSTKNDPKRWGLPFSALLGALKAQMNLKIASIGGKDSMSGTFEDIDVPPTLVSFAVSLANTQNVISPEFKASGNKVALIVPNSKNNLQPDYDSIAQTFSTMQELISNNKIKSAWALGIGGVAEAISKMCFGNKIGFNFNKNIDDETMFNATYGGFVVELQENDDSLNIIGETIEDYVIKQKSKTIVDLIDIEKSYNNKLESIYPTKIDDINSAQTTDNISYKNEEKLKSPSIKTSSPIVLIPVFPGTNCEYDTVKQFKKYGATCDVFVINTLTESSISESINEFAKKLKTANIVMIPGGFSGGDEPDGSGKFITAFFRNTAIKEELHKLLKTRDGLMLGICNGFQALIKLGLIEHGEITDPSQNLSTLTYNTIGRHQSMIVNTRIASNKSPWLKYTQVGETFKVPISHGEGRLIAPKQTIKNMVKNGQIATQYADINGNATMNMPYNPNGSYYAIEGLTSPDGRIFGKMGHSERIGNHLYKNIPNVKDQQIFKAGIEYFK